jgi:hypothetical protein
MASKTKIGPQKRTTKVTASKSAPKNTKLSTEEKLRRRGFSDAQVKAFAENSRRHQGAENDGKGKPPRKTVVKNSAKRRTVKRGK